MITLVTRPTRRIAALVAKVMDAFRANVTRLPPDLTRALPRRPLRRTAMIPEPDGRGDLL
jgi:hypothetical protein